MRQVLDEQKYLDFSGETSLKVVEDYRARYGWIDKCLDENELILWVVHEDLEELSVSDQGRQATFTTENLHEPDRSIRMRLRDGPFSRLDGEWTFTPLRADACKVEFALDYAFAGALLSRALSPVFDQIAASFVDAFVRRAEAVHG